MSSTRSQNAKKKHGKAFDFKWFQRGLKLPPQEMLTEDVSEPKHVKASKTTRSSLAHSRGASLGSVGTKPGSPSRSTSLRNSTLSRARSISAPRSSSHPASRSVSTSNLNNAANAASVHASNASSVNSACSYNSASNNGMSSFGTGTSTSSSSDALRRKLDRLISGDHSKSQSSDLAANSIQFPSRPSRPSLSSRSTRSSSRGSSTESCREKSNSFSHSVSYSNGIVGHDGTPSTPPPRRSNGSASGTNGNGDGSNNEPHFARSFSQETQDFWNRRRKTDDSRSRSRSSSSARSSRRPSETSTSTLPVGLGTFGESNSASNGVNRSNSVAGNGGASGSVSSINENGGPPSYVSTGSDHDPVWSKRTLPLQPPPTIGLGSVLEDRDVIALKLDPMAVRYADHMHMLGYTRNRYVCAMLAEEKKPKEGRIYNLMVMQAFIMRMLRFHGEPSDMSLRKFSFKFALPQESQQIERVLHSFSVSWNYHNPNLFLDEDQVLCAVFSLLMLHTDAFNRNVKRKMSKPDYVRNAALDGIAPEIFGYFYDNITAVPFRADDDVPSASSPSFLFSDAPVTPSNTTFSDSPAGTPDNNSYSTTQKTESNTGADMSPIVPLKSSTTTQSLQEDADKTAVPGTDVTLSVSPATPLVTPQYAAPTVMFPTAQPSTRGPPGTPLGSPNLQLPHPPAPSTPTSGSIGAFSGSPSFPQMPDEHTSKDTNSMGSRRSSSFTWLRDQPLDPYPYISENRLDALRPELSGVPTFSELDIKAFKSIDDSRAVKLQLSAQHTDTLQIVLPRSRSEVYIETPNAANEQKLEAQPRPGVVAVEIVKFGSLLRREWKRSFVGLRPGWREWGVSLTNSRLYLFKNASIIRQSESNKNNDDENNEARTSIGMLQSAFVSSTTNIAAVVVSHSHHEEESLSFFMSVESGSRSPTQHHFAVRSETELKEWIQMINVVATQSTLQVSIEPLSIPRDIIRAQSKVDEQIEAIQSRIDSLAMNLRHFQSLAPLHQRTRESLVFTAGGYSSKCEDAHAELTRLKVYENVLKYALESARETERARSKLEAPSLGKISEDASSVERKESEAT